MGRLDRDRMLVAVLELGSFAKAAARLGTSSSQASKLVSSLESELGVQLVKRTTRALAATEVGRAYAERIKGLIEDFDALDASVRNIAGEPGGRLRVSAPLSFGTSQLVPLLIAFARAYPRIDLDVDLSDRPVALVDEGFDAVVRVGRIGDSSLIARKLCEVRIIPVASPAYLAARGTPDDPTALASHDCVIDTNIRTPALWPFRDPVTGQEDTVPVRGRFRFNSADACRIAAEADLGIARLPSFIAGPAIGSGTLQPLLGPWEVAPYAVNILYPPGRHLAPKVRAFVDYLAETFRGRPPWDFGY